MLTAHFVDWKVIFGVLPDYASNELFAKNCVAFAIFFAVTDVNIQNIFVSVDRGTKKSYI